MAHFGQNQALEEIEDKSSIITGGTSNNNRVSRYNIDAIDSYDEPPLEAYPTHFEAGFIIDPITFQRILTEVMNQGIVKEEEDQAAFSDINEISEPSDDDREMLNNNQLFNETRYDQVLEHDLQQLSQLIQNAQPINDDLAADMIEQLNDVLRTTTIPTNQMISTDDDDDNDQASLSSHLTEHDIPMVYYGHFNRQTIAQELQFDLRSTPSLGYDRFNAKSFAITAWTNVSKDLVMNYIKSEFGIENIRYICISEETSEVNQQQHLHIQIIFKEKINRRRPFLDDVTQTHCNYQVTRNDIAWNAYIKKGGDYIEFGSFRSTRQRGDKNQRLLTSLSSSSIPKDTTNTSAMVQNHSKTRPVSNRPMTVREQTEQRREQNKEIGRQAMKLAETNVHQAMDYMREMMPDKFLHHSSWYLSTFNYINGRIQQHIRETGHIDKEYIWPTSFPHCTPQLKDVVNRWIRHHFSRTKRAKCLILIGSTATGKTSFALSLPGYVNYFKERWNLDSWHDYARYSVYDDIPWDDFSTLNYPNKKGLLTQNGKLNATDKYRRTIEINVRQPAIVLLNPEDGGSLIREPNTIEEQQLAQYWKKRATVYNMGPNEYFYRRQITTTDSQQTNQSSSNSSMETNEERIGDPTILQTVHHI